MGSADAVAGGGLTGGVERLARTEAVAAAPATPPTSALASTRAAARPPLIASLAARGARGFRHHRRGRGPAATSRRPHGLGLDHLADRGRAHLEIDVRVRFDQNAPAARDLELLIDALEALLGVGDRVDGFRRNLARRVNREGDVEVPRLRVDRDLADVPDVD